MVLPALVGAVDSLRFDSAAMRAAAADEGSTPPISPRRSYGTDVPFREAHRRTGALLKELAANERTLRDLTPEEWGAFGVAGGGGAARPGSFGAMHAPCRADRRPTACDVRSRRSSPRWPLGRRCLTPRRAAGEARPRRARPSRTRTRGAPAGGPQRPRCRSRRSSRLAAPRWRG